MKKILIVSAFLLLQACVVPVTIGNTIESSEKNDRKRNDNSPEVVSPEIYNVVGDYDDL